MTKNKNNMNVTKKIKKAATPIILKALKNDGLSSFSASLISILVGIFLGFIILLFVDPANSGLGIGKILGGGFNTGAKGVGNIFYFATPLILTGLSVGFAFKTGLFNIGASGQYAVGALCAIYVGVLWNIPAPWHWIIALLAAMAGGAFWGAIPGFMKALFNVNEVITSIMMNYIGLYFVNYSIKNNNSLFNPLNARTYNPQDSAILPKMGLDKLFTRSSINIGIIIAILVAVLIYIILNKTTFGYELKACGYNRYASKYAGINAKRNIFLSMTIAGGLAGLGAGIYFLSGAGANWTLLDALPVMGFNGIPVALLASSNPIGIIFSALFISYIQRGGDALQSTSYAVEIIDIIIAIIIYMSAFSLLFKKLVKKNQDRLYLKLGGREENINEELPKEEFQAAMNLNNKKKEK